MLGLKTSRRATKWMPSPFMCVMTFLVLVIIFIDNETLLNLVDMSARSRWDVVEGEKVWPEWREEKRVWPEAPWVKKRKRKPPPSSKPALTLPMEDIVNHIESLRKIRNMSGKDNGENVFADQYLTSLVDDDFRPIPMSKLHSNRLVLNPDIAKIPNVVHLIYFNPHSYDWSDYFTFARYVTFKSVEKYIKPGLILFWGDHIPWNSEWWNRTVHEVPNIYYVYAPPVFELGLKVVEFIQHKSDWLRLDFLYRYGGVFLDNDVIILRSFADLMSYTMVMGQDTPRTLATGVILSEKGAEFISKRVKLYDQYQSTRYEHNSIVAYAMANFKDDHGNLYYPIKILPGNFTDPYPYPTSPQKYILYCGHYDLKYNYAVHMYQEKVHVVPRDFKELEGYNCTLGDAMRIALYGDPKLLDIRNAKSGCGP